MMSSAIPSEKYSWSGSPLILLNASTAIEGWSGSGKRRAVHKRPLDIFRVSRQPGLHHKRLYWPGDVLQAERPKFLEGEIEPAMHMIPHRSRDADAARRTLGLKPRRDIHRVSVQVSAVGNRVAKVDPDAEADGSIRRLISVVDRNFLLHLHGTAHRPIDAIEHDEQGVAARLDDPAAVLLNRRIDQVLPQSPQPLERSRIIQGRLGASSQPCRHTARRPASADPAVFLWGPVPSISDMVSHPGVTATQQTAREPD